MKGLLQEHFTKQWTHIRDQRPDWDEAWAAPGGTRDEILKTVRTGTQVDPKNFRKITEEDFIFYVNQSLGRGKAGSDDGFCYDMLILASPETQKRIFEIYYGPFTQGRANRIPDTEGCGIALLPKPGDVTLRTKIRPIGLQSAAHQVGDGLLTETARPEISRVADPTLHGLLRNRAIQDGNWEIRAITEGKIRSGGKWLWLATDVAKAYDEVLRETIATIMEGLGCPKWWIDTWERTWQGVKGRLNTPHGKTGWIHWQRGVVQGSRSGPLQYVMVTIYLTRALQRDAPEVYQVWVQVGRKTMLRGH